MDEKVEKRLEELGQDEEFRNRLQNVESPEDLEKLLEEKKLAILDMSVNEAFNMLKGRDDELDESSLESVSGGVVVSGTLLLATGVVAVSALALCFLAGGLKYTWDNRPWKRK